MTLKIGLDVLMNSLPLTLFNVIEKKSFTLNCSSNFRSTVQSQEEAVVNIDLRGCLSKNHSLNFA